MRTYRLVHNIHHHHLYEPIDPDLALMAGYPRGRVYLVRKLAKDLLGITTLKNYAYFVGRPQGERRMDDTAPSLRAPPAASASSSSRQYRLFSAIDSNGFLALVSALVVPAAR